MFREEWWKHRLPEVAVPLAFQAIQTFCTVLPQQGAYSLLADTAAFVNAAQLISQAGVLLRGWVSLTGRFEQCGDTVGARTPLSSGTIRRRHSRRHRAFF